MRFATLLGAIVVIAALMQPATSPAQQAGVKAAQLPVRKVTLYISGVSYTERQGEVDGDAYLPLLFRVNQINDILKSMVLIDSEGKVQPATYGARDPIGHTLQSFAVDVTGDLSLDRILTQLRGARVSVESQSMPALVGQIVSVEQKQIAGEDGKPLMASFLNLLTEAVQGKSSGLTSVRLDSDRTVRLLDDRLDSEFRAALTLLAMGTDNQRRQVTLHFAGNSRRVVRVGYVQEAPIWKMSYRLLIGGTVPERPGGKPYLQGWAMVENTTDDDWQGVKLSLVSGRPISFIEDLYQPLYIPRPEVGPDIVASPTPQTHDSDLDSAKDAQKPADKPMSSTNGRAFRRLPGGEFGGAKGEAGPAGASGPVAGEPKSPAPRDLLRESVDAQATGQKAGALFQYSISTPVNLPRQQAALIPVIAQDIDAEKLLLYNADSGSRFPLNAVRIKNGTGLHLKGGPVTLFDDGVYAGDSRMEDVPPGESRLLSYAVDLSVEGERQAPSVNSQETSISLRRGVLIVTRRERIETAYTLKSKSDKPRTVLIEHPFQAEYKLVAPEKALERTPMLYRFSVTVEPGKSQSLKVIVERPISQTVGIVDEDLNALISYTSRKTLSPKIRAILEEVVLRRRRVQELQSAAANRAQEVQSINADQDRIRKNMGVLDKASSLYKRYLAEMDSQETHINSLRAEAVRLRSQAEAADRDLRAYVDTISDAN